MKCKYDNIDCRYVFGDGEGMIIPCEGCELYPYKIRPTGGCLSKSVTIIIIIILLML